MLAALRVDDRIGNLVFMNVRWLLVDDSPEFLASASRLLRTDGVQVVGRATTSSEALDAVAELEPDVALIDIELGDEDGIALARQLAELAPSLQIVLISAYDPADVDELVIDSRARGFVSKSSFSPEAVRALL